MVFIWLLLSKISWISRHNRPMILFHWSLGTYLLQVDKGVFSPKCSQIPQTTYWKYLLRFLCNQTFISKHEHSYQNDYKTYRDVANALLVTMHILSKRRSFVIRTNQWNTLKVIVKTVSDSRLSAYGSRNSWI